MLVAQIFHADVDWQDLKDHMRKAGDVVRANIMTDPDGKRYGICKFAHKNHARTAIYTLNETDLKGRTIYLRKETECPPPLRSKDDLAREDRGQN